MVLYTDSEEMRMNVRVYEVCIGTGNYILCERFVSDRVQRPNENVM